MEDTRIDSHNATVHRTGHFTDEQVRHLKESASRQERLIGRVYLGAYPKRLTPSQAHKIVEKWGFEYGLEKSNMWPLTSTRRAITNLTEAGILTKTDRTAEGEYGRPEHLWMWKAPEEGKSQQADMFGSPDSRHQNGVMLLVQQPKQKNDRFYSAATW